MFERFTPVNVRFANRNGAVRSYGNIGPSIAFLRWQTNGCAGFSQGCLPRKLGAAASNSWRASPDYIVTPSRSANGSYGRNVVCPPVVYAVPAPDANSWKKNARGTDGLAGTFARCDRWRPDQRHEMDASFAAKTLQGLASAWGKVVSDYTRSLVAAAAVFAANVSQAKSGHPQSPSRPPIPLPAPAAELVFDTKMAGN